MSQSQSPHQTFHFVPEERTDRGRGSHCHPPQSTQHRTLREPSHFYDSSDLLFAMYLRIAEEQDRKRAELLKADTDPILVFCGLFSATLAALVVVSMPDLRPNFQDYALQDTIVYLATLPYNLAQALTHPNDQPSPAIDFGFTGFSPSYHSVLVNSFWLLSLLISLTCALMAILLQQWAHRHGKIASPSYCLLEQARMRVFFAAGIERLNFEFVQEALRVLIQCSLVLFFAGFLLFVLALGNTVFAIACAWIGLCLVAYAYITFLPIFRPGSPFSTPLSDAWARVYAVAAYAILHILWSATRFAQVSNATREYFRRLKNYHRDLFLLGTMKIAEEETRQRTLEIDGDVLKRTLDGLSGDQDLGQFFEGILGFCDSEIVKDPQKCLDTLGRKRLGQTLEGFWNRTLSSDLVTVPEAERRRRIVTFLKVINAARLSPDDLGGVFRSIQLGHSLRDSADDNLVLLARCIISGILSNAERDDRWLALAKGELGVSEEVLRSYLAHGDSVLLANLIHFIRQILPLLVRGAPDLTREPLRILPSVSKLDILNTLPELQHEFCAAWNEIIRHARNGEARYDPFSRILVEIRHLYVALHPTDATPQGSPASTTGFDEILRQPTSYLMCETASHHSDVISDIHGAASDTAGKASHPTAPITTSRALPDPDVVLVTVTPLVSSFSSDPPNHSSGDSESPSGDTADVPQSLNLGAASPSCYSSPLKTQIIPTASTHTVTQGIGDNFHDSSMTKPISHSPSNADDSLRSNKRKMVCFTTFKVPDHILRGPDSSSPVPTNAL